MTDTPRPPAAKPKSPTGAELRKMRQAEALRANLARRKQQERERTDTEPEVAPSAQADLALDRAKR
ncbi:hypothetical protein [Magnetospirillum moscoviense]|uniref:Uncharacterized protein n=1 Tax=Magnetospirillum moscoviense TaxID=1437059 RepID=A0A178MQA0_9PROT|nr:hypothetical protein [Magnetospirillum moscoviense]MBF0325661.1 hypothetical protein [Alphaproteobacteria bacterium]OAN51166.1 hypothetical protein A6A05_11350 [Magnetospirillum moscoviense]